MRERQRVKVGCLAPGAVGRERAPAPAPKPAPPAPGPRLPIDPRGKALGLLRSLPGSGLQVRDRRGGGEGPEGGDMGETASVKPEGMP